MQTLGSIGSLAALTRGRGGPFVPPGPTPTSAAVNAASLAITFSEALKTTDLPPGTAFTVLVDGIARTVSTVAAAGSTVTLTLASAVTFGQAVTVAYTAPAPGANALQSMDGRRVASFGPNAVVNETPAGPSFDETYTVAGFTPSQPITAGQRVVADLYGAGGGGAGGGWNTGGGDGGGGGFTRYDGAPGAGTIRTRVGTAGVRGTYGSNGVAGGASGLLFTPSGGSEMTLATGNPGAGGTINPINPGAGGAAVAVVGGVVASFAAVTGTTTRTGTGRGAAGSTGPSVANSAANGPDHINGTSGRGGRGSGVGSGSSPSGDGFSGEAGAARLTIY